MIMMIMIIIIWDYYYLGWCVIGIWYDGCGESVVDVGDSNCSPIEK